MMDGKVVVVTGSSLGIGRETALLFAKEEANVVVTYNKEKKKGEEVFEKCKELGSPDPLILQLDVRDNQSIKDAVKKIIKKYEKIDVLINNAGVLSWKDLNDQYFSEIHDQIRTNLEGLIKMTKASLPHIKETIINIASGAGQVAYGGMSTYSATKFGVRGFTQALAQELPNIKVYAVNPGMTKTRMTDYRGDPPEKVAQIILNTVKGKYNVESGGDINVWEY